MSVKTKEEFEKKQNRQFAGMRSVLDYVMGAVIFFAGVFVMIRGQFDLALNKQFPPDKIDIVLGVLFIVYGGWRIYRGYKKNYFK